MKGAEGCTATATATDWKIYFINIIMNMTTSQLYISWPFDSSAKSIRNFVTYVTKQRNKEFRRIANLLLLEGILNIVVRSYIVWNTILDGMKHHIRLTSNATQRKTSTNKLNTHFYCSFCRIKNIFFARLFKFPEISSNMNCGVKIDEESWRERRTGENWRKKNWRVQPRSDEIEMDLW